MVYYKQVKDVYKTIHNERGEEKMKATKKQVKDYKERRKAGNKAFKVVTTAMLVTSALAVAPVSSFAAQDVNTTPTPIVQTSAIKASETVVQAKMSIDKPTYTIVKGQPISDLRTEMGVHAKATNKGAPVDYGFAAKIDDGGLDINKVGTYNVKFTVDVVPDNNPDTRFVGTISGKVVVAEANKPVLNVKPATVKQGSVFNVSDWASAVDKEDGNITSKIKVFDLATKKLFNTDKLGTFNVEYDVKDSDGNLTYVQSTVTVVANDGEVAQKPTFNYPATILIKVGDVFDPLKGVYAKDTTDGDITSKIKVTTNTVDTTKVGEYKVVFEVTNSKGATATATQRVYVSSVDVGTPIYFKDVQSSHWAYKEITSLVDKKVISGYSDGTFKPTNSIRRDHVALLLSKALDLKPVVAEKKFKDVPKSSPYYEAIKAVQMAGIFDGNNGKFNPTANITRAEMAKVMVVAFNIPMTNKDAGFTDVPKSSFAYKYIQALSESGITVGKGDGTFSPNSSITRAEYSVFLHRALNM